MLGGGNPPIIPRPLHNEKATLVATCRSLLMDMDRSKINTTLPTATLELILTKFVELCEPGGAAPTERAATLGAMFAEPAVNPNLRYLRAREAEDDSRALPAED